LNFQSGIILGLVAYGFHKRSYYLSFKNKKMKKIIMGLAIVLAVSSVSSLYAQQGQMDPAARKAALVQKLKDDLKLTDVQADSVASIQQEYRPQMRDIFMDQSLSQDDKKAKMAVLNDQADKRIKPVLGDDLFKKYKEWQEKNRPQRGGGGKMNQ
jgi:hypothetical protein